MISKKRTLLSLPKGRTADNDASKAAFSTSLQASHLRKANKIKSEVCLSDITTTQSATAATGNLLDTVK